MASMVPWETGLSPGSHYSASATPLALAYSLNVEMDSAVQSLIIHVNDFQSRAGSHMLKPSALLLHLHPQTRHPGHHPEIQLRPSSFAVLSYQASLHSYGSSSRRPPGSARPCPVTQVPLFWLLPCFLPLGEAHVFTPGLKGRGQTRSSQTLSDSMNLDVFLHSRYQSRFYLP